MIISNLQKYIGESFGCIILSVVDHAINIPKYDLSADSSYIKLPNKLEKSKKGLINVDNVGYNEYFKWCSVRFPHPADRNPRRITKDDKLFADKLEFADKISSKKLKIFTKLEKRNLLALAFVIMIIKQSIQIMCQKMF